MKRLFSIIRARFDSLNETQLRVIYSILALLSLSWVALATTVFIGNLDSHSDETRWEVRRVNGEPALIVDSFTEGGVADRAVIKESDRVISINGRAVTPEILKRSKGQELLDEAPGDRPISYVVVRAGRVIPLQMTLTRRHDGAGIWLLPILYTFTFLWLAIGTMVVLAQPRGRIQRTFFLTAASSTFAFSLPNIASGAFGGDSLIGAILGATQTIIGALFFSTWLYFCSLFPVDQNLFRNVYGRIALVIPPAMMIVVICLGLSLESAGNDNIVLMASFGIAIGVMLLVDILYFVSGIILLYRGYSRLAPTTERRSMRVILAGTVLTTVALLYLPVMALFPAFGIKVGVALLIPMALIIALPVSFGYAIFRYQVMDFRLVVKTTLVYVATMMLVGGIYLGVAYGIAQIFGAFIGQRFKDTIEIAVFVLSLLLFDPLKRQLQVAIENRFFPQHRDYSSHLTTFAASVERSVNTASIAELMVDTLRETLDLANVVVVANEARGLIVLARTTQDVVPIAIDQAALKELADLVEKSHGIVALEVAGGSLLDELRVHFAYAAGLFAQGRLIGFVLISRPAAAVSLRGRQVQFLSNIATQGATALEVARLYEEELARQRYDEQLASARHIQESLLTTDIPELPGLTVSVAAHPAQAVGGDYFRVIRIDDSRVLVIVADVSGKGLPASLYMAQLHGMVCIVGATCTTPAEMLTTINDHLYAEMARGTFVTATVLLFDAHHGIVHYARAGHTPIIVRTGDKLRMLAPRGLALGIVPSSEFLRHLEERTVRFEVGDTFILYSDGVSEAMNSKREEFGDDRLVATITDADTDSPTELSDAILADVENFRGGAEQNDDVTVVIVRVDMATDSDHGTGDVSAEIATSAH
ncbi:MAG: SpoIIE family protein phosphatase [bacterium]|nr:SpoIIE family protein phosphatase [Candidatus Kapabacteria bacterium]